MKKLLVMLVAAGASTVFADLPAPMVWFDMKEMNGAKVKDASGNGCDLTLGSTVEIVDDQLVGKALKVTGKTTDWATFSCPVVTNTTICFWLRRDAQDSSILNGAGAEQNSIPYIMSTGYSGFGINYSRNNADISLIDQQNSPQSNFSGAGPKRCEWHHMAFAISYSDEGDFGKLTCRSYLDGTFVKETVQANNKAMRLPGKQNVILLNNAAPGNRPTSGLYADFRFYDTCLSDEEVLSVVFSNHRNMLVMRYAFEEISASVDKNGRHSTPEATGYSSAMTLGKNMTLVDDGVEGKALHFMATSEVGGLVTAPSMPLAERTYSVWVRLSSRCTELNAIVENPYPRLFNEHRATAAGNGGYCIFNNQNNTTRGFQFMPSGCGTSSKATANYAVTDFDVWSHLTIVEHYDAGGSGGVVDFYVNGEPAAVTHTAYELEILPGSVPFQIGNSGGLSGNRHFCGDMDEFRLYNYALSSNEVKRLYRGLARIDAGEDFTVAGSKGVLHGTVGANAGDNYRKGYAGELAWSLVSAPEGGEGAAILQPHAAETPVTLPVAGTYVFRLTISDLGVAKSDDVTVTCVAADGANAAPTVSVTASSPAITQPDAVTLTATVTDDDKPSPAKTRVRWAKTSGPGGVWFDSDDAVVTKVSFGAAGNYVLTCTADDGQATASADVTVVVADRADGKSITTDMIHYWSLDSQCVPYSPDGGSSPKALTTLPDYNLLRYVPGKVGNGARAYAYSGAGAYWTPNTSIEEVAIDDPDKAYGGSLPPKNDYLTISAWIYIDPDDENLKAGKVVGANVVGQGYTFGLRYNEKWSPADAVNQDGFTLYQQGRGGSTASGGVAYCMVHYPAPNPSPVGRWMHICGILARNVSNNALWEMWYDGVKQTASRTFGNNRGRINTNKLMIGGMEYTGAAKNADGSLNAGGSYNANWPIGTSLTEFYTRTFPGVVDEVRIWTRKLTPEEIRFLAANPIIDANRGPVVEAPTASPRSPAANRPATVATAAFADKLPVGGTLTYAWSIISGDASLASFSDATLAETTFTASEKGTYVLQLAVSDGERTVYSKPLVLEVPASGMVILVK